MYIVCFLLSKIQNSKQLSNHVEQQLQWGAPGSWHWNGSVPGMGWEEPGPLLAILNTAVQSIDLHGNRSGPGSATPKRSAILPILAPRSRGRPPGDRAALYEVVATSIAGAAPALLWQQ